MELSLVNILSVIILFQLLLLILFLFSSSKGKKVSNYLLAVFFLLLFFNIADGLLSYYGWFTDHPQYAHIEDGFVFLLGPVLYFYTVSIIFKDFKWRLAHALHLIPFVMTTLSYQVFYHLQTEEYQRMIQTSITHQTLPASFYVSIVIIYFHLGGYLFVSFRNIFFYRIEIRNQFSSTRKIDLDWLTFMLGSVAAVLLASAVFTFLPVVGLQEYLNYMFVVAFVVLFVFVSVVVWKGLKQPELFSGIDSDSGSEKKYAGSSLSERERKDIKKNLEEFMIREKPFLDPDLSLDQLARSLNTTSKKLSQCINEEFSQNFFDYVNSSRIAEAQRIFRENKDPRLTVLEVMYQCGFNSKSSFNTIFKAKTGVTPSAFKKGTVD